MVVHGLEVKMMYTTSSSKALVFCSSDAQERNNSLGWNITKLTMPRETDHGKNASKTFKESLYSH